MPILRLFTSAGTGATVPDATTTTAGKVRLATIAEANGTSELIAVTPAGLQAELAGLTGGMEFKGAYDIGIGVPDLTTGSTKKGDYYVVTNVKLNPTDTNVTKELYGQEWAVGDHLVVTRDIASGETDYDDAITKVDNSESISVLGDLLDVTVNNEVDRQGLVYSDGTWVNGDMVYVVPDLEDVTLEPNITSASYITLSAFQVLTDQRDHVIDLEANLTSTTTKTMNLPSSVVEGESVVYVTNIGGANTEVEVNVPSGDVFVGGVTTPVTVARNVRAKFVGAHVKDGQGNVLYNVWSASTQAVGERQVLASSDDLTTWRNDFLNVSQVLGAARTVEVFRMKVSSGFNSYGQYIGHDGSNYIDASTSLRSADVLLDGAIKTEEEARIAGDSALQTQINTANSRITLETTQRTNADSALQTELDATQTGAGLEADGSYTANASTNYLTTATSLVSADEALDAKLKETRDLVDNLGANNVSSVNGETPVAGDVTLGGVHINTAHSATNYTAAGADLDSHLAGIDAAFLTESTARADADTTLQSNIDAEATTRANADTAEATARANADTAEATARANADTALQAELDATQAGAGLEADGSYVANASTNYLTTATSLKGADEALDAQLKTVTDLVDSLGANNVSSVNGVSPVAGDVTLGAGDIDSARTAVNYTTVGASIDNHLTGVDAALGAEATARTDADTALQAELDATQAGAGLETDGTYVSNASTNYINAVISLKGADEALDAQLKTVTDITDTLGTASTKDAGSAIGEVVLLGDVGGNAALPAVDGSQLTGITVDLTSGSIGELGDVTLTTPAEGDALILNASGDFVNTALATIATSGEAVDATSAHTATNYTAAASDVDSHLAGIDTQFGSVTTSLAAHQSEINATQTGAGLQEDGSYVAPTVDGDYLASATSLYNADVLLSSRVFLNSQKNSAELPVYSINSSQSGSQYADVMYIIPMGSSALTINLPDATDAEGLLNEANGFAVSNRSANTVTVALGVQTANIGGVDYQVYFGGELESDPSTEYDALITSVTVAPRTTLYFAMDRHTVGGSLNRYVFYPRKIDSLAQMSDVDLTGIADGDALVYSATNGRFEVSPLGTSSVQTVNSVAPVGGNVTLGGADIDTAHTAQYYTAASADLDTHIAGIDNAFLARAIVDNDIMTGAGLENDGSYVANASTNYITTATSLKGADEALDAQVKTNADNIALKANIASPALTGTPTAPTAAQGTNTTQIATTAYVKTELASLSTTAQGAEGVVQVSDGSGNFVASQWKVPSANGHLTPSASSTYDLGTASARARDLFADSVKLGSASLAVSVDGTSGRLISGGGGTALTADSAEVVLASDLATVATSGDYGDLSNAPTSFINSAEFITDADPLNIVAGKHYIMGTATGSTKTLTLPSVTANGQYIRVTNWGLGELVVQVDPADTNAYLLVGQNIVNGGAVTIESKATVDLFGFNYSQGGTDYSPAWGVYFSSSIELNTKSFSTTGQLPYYDATAQELKAGDLGNLTFSFAPSNYDNTRGGTVTGDAVGDHFGGVDDALGLKANSADLADIATSGASADASVTLTATEYTAATQDVEAHLTGIHTRLVDLVDTINGEVVGVGTHEITLGGEHIDTAHTASDYTAASADLDTHIAGIDARLAEKVNAADGLNGLDDVDLTTSAPQDGEILIYNATSSLWEPNPPPAPLATETSVGLVEYATDAETTAGTADNVVLRPSNISSIEISSLLNAGTAATADTGTAIGDVVALEDVGGSAGLPAVDGSQLTGISVAAPPVNAATGGTITVPTGSEAFWIMSPTADATVTLSAPTAGEPGTGDDGKKLAVKNFSAFELTLSGSIDGAASFVMAAENSAITLVAYNGGWYIV